MEQTTAPRFFLGANSKSGFCSLYDSFPNGGEFLWVIKGCPGCGKSSFMRRIGDAAKQAGLHPEYILCSGDPDSLDGVRIPEKHIAYVDGTAPHVIEPRHPGAGGLYLDLSRFLDAGGLQARAPELLELERRYQAQYAAAYAQLTAAAALLPKNQPGVRADAAEAALARRIGGIAARELRPLKKRGTCAHRFLSAWSCQGHLLLRETVGSCCARVIVLDNKLGLGHTALDILAEAAEAGGYDRILCHDPLEPEKPEALLLPERSLAFLAVGDDSPALPPADRRLRLDAHILRSLTSEARRALRQRRKESRAMLRAATETLAQAKALHDELEAVYHPHVDFDGVSELAEDHIRWLLEP